MRPFRESSHGLPEKRLRRKFFPVNQAQDPKKAPKFWELFLVLILNATKLYFILLFSSSFFLRLHEFVPQILLGSSRVCVERER